MLAFYLCRDSEVSGNTIINSPGAGIYYSLPSYDNIIATNMIRGAADSGIKISRNAEHEIPTTSRYTGLYIQDNTIDDTRFFGIEVDQMSSNVYVQRNDIQDTDFHGIYIIRSNHLEIADNQISTFGLWKERGKTHDWNSDSNGVFVEFDVQNSRIASNQIQSLYGYGDFGIRVTTDNNTGNLVEYNTLIGTYTQMPILVEGDNISNGNITEEPPL